MTPDRTLQEVPHLEEAPQLAAGHVGVMDRDAHGVLQSQLPAGKRAVLVLAGGHDAPPPLELLTVAAVPGNPTAPGAYLNPADLLRAGGHLDDAHLRAYGTSDLVRKLCSRQGIALLVPPVLAFLAAGAAFAYTLFALGPPTTPVPARAESALAWALTSPPGGHSEQVLAPRSAMAIECLQHLAGEQAPTVTIPGVSCSTPSTPLWRSSTFGASVSAGFAVLIALAGALSLRPHLKFGASPAS